MRKMLFTNFDGSDFSPDVAFLGDLPEDLVDGLPGPGQAPAEDDDGGAPASHVLRRLAPDAAVPASDHHHLCIAQNYCMHVGCQ